MKFLILMVLVYMGYRLILPKKKEIDISQKSEIDDGEYIDYEDLG